MPRLLLEGKSITELLARVRAEHGPDVAIVAADKVRTGGIGGFFARESYALTVEVPGAGAGGGRPDPSLMHEQVVAAIGTNRTPNDHPLMPERIAGAQAPGSLLDLAAAIDAAEAAEQDVILATAPMHASTQRPALSTASPAFRSILERLSALDAPEPVSPQPVSPQPASPQPAVGVPGSEPDAWARLREVVAEIAPHVDLGTGVPIVLVIAPGATTEHPGQADSPNPTAAAIPRQGRHRREAPVTAWPDRA